MSNPEGFLTLLAEDNALIVYRKSLKQITNSVTATILLQQIIHRFKSKERIYKFKAPCDHERYRPGDSWTEELGFSVKEFDTALKKIGTKLIKGLQKKNVLGGWEPNAIVVYWTDRSRVTWYELNRPLLNAYLSVIYLNAERVFRKVTKGELLIYLPKGYLHDLPESPSESPHSGRDFLQDFQADVVESIDRHTDQEMIANDTPSSPSADRVTAFGEDLALSAARREDYEILASTGVSTKGPPLMIGDTLVDREIIHQILKLRQEDWSFKQISEKLSIPIELINDMFIKHKFYLDTEIASTKHEAEAMFGESQIDEVETVFGPNPRQVQIDAYQPGELSRAELMLSKLGSVDGSTRHYLKRIKDSGWNIRDEDVELGLAVFAMVTGFALPTTKAQRRLWETGIREHLAEELFKGHLRVLYDKVWDKIKPEVFEGRLTITHPKALTQWMYQEINAEARPTPLTRAQITSRLVGRGLVELREFEGDRVDYVWAATGQFVSEMSLTFLKEQIG